MSVRQTPHARTRARTSPGPGSGTGRSAGALGVLLEARGGVENVADEDDLLPQVAQLAGGDGAAMESAAKAGHDAEVPGVHVRRELDGLPDEEKAPDAVGVADTSAEGPGDDDFIARVLVDLAARFEDGLREAVHDAPEKLEVPGAAQPFRVRRRIGEVEEEEDALLGSRPVIDAGDEVPENARPDHAVHLDQELDRESEHNEKRQRVGQVRVRETLH